MLHLTYLTFRYDHVMENYLTDDDTESTSSADEAGNPLITNFLISTLQQNEDTRNNGDLSNENVSTEEIMKTL